MKAISYAEYGDPAQVLAPVDVPMPAPAAGEALIRMVLSSIHNHDLWTVRGQYGVKPALPALAGSEAVGVVEAVGDGVDAALIGKRVVAAGTIGKWAEYFTADAAGLLPLPDAIDDEAGAQLVAMPFSAITLLDFIDVKAGDWVIQTAANGAVGRIFHDLAKTHGINTLNLVRRPDAMEALLAAGFEHVLCTADDGWEERARAILGDQGAQAAIDSIGGAIVNDIVSLLGLNGLLVSFGSAIGEPMQISSGTMITNHITIKGFWGARVAAEMAPEKKAALMRELVTLTATGKLDLPAGGIYPLDEITRAVRASLTPGRGGKILLRP